MPIARKWTVHPRWRLLLQDAGLNPIDILRRAGLPDDLFSRKKATLTTEQYFDLFRAIGKEADDPLLPLRIGQSFSVEAFDPPIFASLCSPDLNTALGRLSHYKPLIAPMRLHVDVGQDSTTMHVEWTDITSAPPMEVLGVELVFFVQLARIATRAEIRPLKVTSPAALEPAKPYTEYFGVPVRVGTKAELVFSAGDAARPFLTANEGMWQFFEPELRRRLSELDEAATTSMRVQGALLELLPSGRGTATEVARKLGASTRSLQRHLKQEGETFRTVLNRTREELARYYLKSSAMTGQDISFLLGFGDPNSFYRAFHSWTGETPEQARSAMIAGS